jgi:hypothetical protein
MRASRLTPACPEERRVSRQLFAFSAINRGDDLQMPLPHSAKDFVVILSAAKPACRRQGPLYDFVAASNTRFPCLTTDPMTWP